MKKILFLSLSIFLSVTIISCAKKDNSSSSSSSTDNLDTSNSDNICQTEGSTSRNVSLVVTPTLSRHSEQTGRVLYVDKSALSQYQRDDYLMMDPYSSNYFFCGNIGGGMKGVPDNCDEVDLGDSGPILGSEFTQEAWIWSEKTTWPWHREIMGASHDPSGKSYQRPPTITYNYDTHIRYGFGTGSSQIQFIVKGVVTPRAWNHIAVTFDGTTMRLFVNGEQVHSSQAAAGMTPISEPVRYIGENFQGKIDEVRMWNVARTQAEIQANMNKTLVGNETGLEAYYPMDVNNNWEIIDKSPRANHAKITNTEILSRFISDNSSCSNGPDGTTSCPYPTIRSALDNVTSGDHVYIRQGRYTELLNKWQLNHSYETQGPKIVIEAYPNEEVIIDGTVALNDNSSNWVQDSLELDNGTTINIYKTVINFDNITREIMTPVDNITQVFVNGRYMIPAMPLNFKNPTDPTTGNPMNPEPGTVWADLGRSPFRYPEYDNGTWHLGREWYMPAQLENLDFPEEWAFDSGNKTLYLYASDNYTPTSTNVRVRVRDRFLIFTHSDNIEFKNIHFFAGSFFFYNSSYITFEDSKFSFNSDMGLRSNKAVFGTNMTVRNSIFEYINDGQGWSSERSIFPTMENVLFRYNDWFMGSALYATVSRNYRSNKGSPNFFRGDSHWRYVTVENSKTGGIGAGYGSLVEYARFENLYEGCDCSGIQRNAAATKFSTTRYTWIINAPYINGMRFDSDCSGTNGDINNVVSIGNRRGFRLKGDYHDVYHVTAYDNTKMDISLPDFKYCGLNGQGSFETGNWNSNLKNSIAEGSLQCYSHACYARDDVSGNYSRNFDFHHLDSSGIWFGRSMSVNKWGTPNSTKPWADPHFEMVAPWIQSRARSDSFLLDTFGGIPWDSSIQNYDFRPKKGSYLIDSGVIIPGINDGKDEKVFLENEKPGVVKCPRSDTEDSTIFNHPSLYTGQNRKYVGSAPDIGAYEYGDTVYWIPGFRYPHPSVPIPNDGAEDVPIDYSLVWNYPYKKDYSNTKATVTVSGPGVNRTEEFQYPHNVLFQAFEPGGTYNWSVTVDNVSGGNWSFKVSDKVYPLNDRSVDITDNTSLIPYQINNLEVSNNKMSFLRFDIPSSITSSHKIKLNLVLDGESTIKDSALDFDGTNDYVVANGVTSSLNSSTGLPFTVSAWANPDTTTKGAIFAFHKSGSNLNLLYYAKDGSTKKFYHYGPNNSYTESTNTFEPGQWHHIALIVDSSGNGKLFVNGGQEATWSNGTNSSVNRFSIGQEWDGSGTAKASDFFDGKIDEVAVWNVALSAADVTALYNSGNGLKASADSGNYDNSGDLIGYWKFNDGTGSTLTDSTSNSNNGTLNNMDSSDWVTSGFNLIGGFAIHKYDQLGWGEDPDNKNIGIIDHSLGATIVTLTSLDNGTTVWDNGTAVSLDNGTTLSVDLTDKITSYGEEYSIAIRVLETTDKVTFFSKEKQLTDGVWGFAPQKSVWPNISFK